MKTPFIYIPIPSIYNSGLLPRRMAQCTPDTYKAISCIAADVKKAGGNLVLSDLFRSYDMQFQAHLDWKTKKKKAFSPPPGGSMHEAGRAMDIDLSKIKISLKEFWDIAQKYGVYPIINEPNSRLSEAWHFDCRGSHGLVYNYYAAGKGNNMPAYTAMAASGILSINVKVDKFEGREKEASIQSGLIRLGYDLGNMDGYLGAKSYAAIQNAGIAVTTTDEILVEIENKLQAAFPGEYSTQYNDYTDVSKPPHIL